MTRPDRVGWHLFLAVLMVMALVAAGCGTVSQPGTGSTAAPAGSGEKPAAAQPTPTAPPQPAALKKVNFVSGFTTPSIWPIWVGMEKGIFNKYGLDVVYTAVEGSPKAVAAVLGGSADLANQAAGTWLGPVAQGAAIKVVSTTESGSNDTLYVKPEIDSPAKLKGKKVAIGGYGDLSHLTAWLMLEKKGLDPSKDVAFVQIGSDPARAAALASGSVDAAPLNQEHGEKVQKEFGFRPLISGPDESLSFPAANLGMTDETLKNQRPMVKAFLKGMIEATDWLYQPGNEGPAKEILAKAYKTQPTDRTVELAYAMRVKPRKFRLPPTIDEEGFVSVQQFSVRFNPAIQDVKLSNLLDRTVLEEAVKEMKP